MGCCHEKRVNEPPLFATSEAAGCSAWQWPAAGYILFKNEAKDLVSVLQLCVGCISVNVNMNDLKLLVCLGLIDITFLFNIILWRATVKMGHNKYTFRAGPF